MTAILLSPWTAYGLTLAAAFACCVLGRLMERRAWISELSKPAEAIQWPERPGR